MHIGTDLQCQNIDVLIHRDLCGVSIVRGNRHVWRVSVDMYRVTHMPRELHMSRGIDV